jgi:UDP-galactose transporter B1
MASERATRARARSIKMGASASKPATTATGGPTSGKHKEAKLALAVGGIFFAFSAFAVLQEDVYATKHGPKGEKFTHTFFVLLVERAVNTVVGALGCAAFGRTGIDVPIREILVSGVSQMLAMATGNEALRYVSFTTQVLGKSCKMVPVMIGGVAAGRKYPTSQYLQVLVVTLGVVVFNLGKSKPKSAADDSAFGLGLIALSLGADFVTAMLQDRVKTATKRRNPRVTNAKTSTFESMAWTNAGGFVAALVTCLATGQLADGIEFTRRHPAFAKAIGAYALSSVIGQLFVYYTITEFDSLVLSTVTTTRKIFSTVYSAFRKPENALNATQWGGCGLVFAALGYELLEKYLRRGKRVKKA